MKLTYLLEFDRTSNVIIHRKILELCRYIVSLSLKCLLFKQLRIVSFLYLNERIRLYSNHQVVLLLPNKTDAKCISNITISNICVLRKQEHISPKEQLLRKYIKGNTKLFSHRFKKTLIIVKPRFLKIEKQVKLDRTSITLTPGFEHLPFKPIFFVILAVIKRNVTIQIGFIFIHLSYCMELILVYLRTLCSKNILHIVCNKSRIRNTTTG